MSLEEAVAANTAAVERLTAQLAKGVGGGSAATETKPTGKPGRPRAVTLDEVRAIAEKLAEKKGNKAAVREIIKAHGAAQLADLDKSKYSTFIAACEVAMNEDEGDGDGGGDDDL